MKLPLVFSALLSLFALSGQAGAVSVWISPGAEGLMVQTSDGTLLSGGGYYIAVGTFGLNPPPPQNPVDISLAYSFAIFGAGTSPTTGPDQGALSLTVAYNFSNPQNFNGNTMWLLIGNGSSRETSTEFGFLNLGLPFPGDVTPPGTVPVGVVDITFVNTVIGSEINSPSGTRDIIQLVPAVPEPASGLLALLGGVVMRRRRRNEI